MRRTTLLTALTIGFVVSATGPAQASCLAPPSLEQGLLDAPVVFVGTVVDFGGDDRQAIVEVESVWRGDGVASLVGIDGGFAPNAATSVDRSYHAGRRYIFFPVTADVPFLDNACTLTQQMTDDIEALAPDTATAPMPGEAIEFPPLGPDGFPVPPEGETGVDVAVPAPGEDPVPVDVDVDRPDALPVGGGDERLTASRDVDPVADSYLLPLGLVVLVVLGGIVAAIVASRIRSRPVD